MTPMPASLRPRSLSPGARARVGTTAGGRLGPPPRLARRRMASAVGAAIAALVAAALTPPADAQTAAAADAAATDGHRLQPVVVTGSRVEQRAFDLPYAIDVVDEDSLRAGGLMVNLSESMAAVPGLTVNNRSNYAQDLQISSRGFGARSSFGVRGLRLYNDGIPATMPDGQGQVAHFDLAGAERVEVLRGPFSALYGNSSGGVIALYSRPVRDRRVEFGLDAARFGTWQARVSVEAPFKDDSGTGFDIRASLSHFETDGFRPHSEARRTLGNIRLGWTGERDQLVVSINRIDQPADDPLGLTRAQFSADPRQTASVALPGDTPGQAGRFDTRKTVEQDQIGAHWRHRFAGEFGALRESQLTAYGGRRSVVQYQAIPVATQRNPNPPPNTERQPGGVIDFDRDYVGVDGRLVWRWTLPGERHLQLVAGAAYERSTEDRKGYENFLGDPAAPDALGVRGLLRRDERNTVDTTDVYAQGEFEITPRWVATLGLRHGKVDFSSRDRYVVGLNPDDSGSLDYRYTNPVGALQWRLSRELNLYASVGRGFESPTFNELAYRPDGGGGFNSELRAQTSTQFELGAKWRPEGSNLLLDAAVFHARTSDEIGVATNAGGRSAFQNVGRTQRRGAELGLAWEPSRHWRGALALTVLSATYDQDFLTCTAAPCNAANPQNQALVTAGNRIAGTSPRGAYGEIAWRPGEAARTELAAEWRAQGRTAVNDRNTDFAGGYATFGLRARQTVELTPTQRLEFLARLDNVFDRDYAGSVIVNEGNGRFFETGMPRAWLLGVRWRIGF